MKRVLLFMLILGQSLLLFPRSPLAYPHLSIANFGILKTKIEWSTLVLVSFAILYLFIVAIVQLNDLDIQEFLKSLINLILFFLALVSVLSLRRAIGNVKSLYISIARLAAIYTFAQVLLLLAFNSQFLYFFLDPISISTAEDIGRFEAVNLLGYFRPFGFYHEPSYLALVSNILFIKIYSYEKTISYSSIFCIVASLSIVGLLTLILSIFFISDAKKKVVTLAVTVMLLVVFSDFFRFAEILREGTSGYERVGVIYETIKSLSERNALPIALGNFEKLPNNSLQVIIGYFGLLAPLIIIFILTHSPGAITFIIGFTGCVGALRENTALLAAYAIFLAVLLLLEMTAGILGFIFKEWIKDQVREIVLLRMLRALKVQISCHFSHHVILTF